MVKKLDKLPSSTSKANLPSDYQIIGKFCIDNFHFLVISVDEFTKDLATLLDNQMIANDPFAVLGYFGFGGKRCLIVNGRSISEDLAPDIASLLTERELQIAALIALGRSNKQVAHQLGISEWTISAHLRRIYIKLGVDSRAAMVYRCSSLIHRVYQLGTMVGESRVCRPEYRTLEKSDS